MYFFLVGSGGAVSKTPATAGSPFPDAFGHRQCVGSGWRYMRHCAITAIPCAVLYKMWAGPDFLLIGK